MNWEAIGALGESISAIAVILTLVYLASQIRQLKKQSSQSTLQHIHDSMNQFMDMLSDEANAALVVKGRVSYTQLSEVEKLRFFAIHARFLNTVSSWHELVLRNFSRVEQEQTILNLKENVRYFCCYPGFQELWLELRSEFAGEFIPFIEECIS